VTSDITYITFDPESVLTQFNASQWLDNYWKVLSDENSRVNLVSRETTSDSFRRIVGEALLPLTQFSPNGGRYLDIGSGGGIPAIPLLLAGVISAPPFLYERTGKKAAALSRMLDTLEISGATVIAESFGQRPMKERFSLITLSWVALTPALLKSIAAVMEPGSKLVYYSRPDFVIRDHEVSVFSYSQSLDDIHKYFSIITK
jgi:16S rRNA (guanine527-N7)-methyltransferase